MPKDTFYRLKDEKKQRIFDAAVQEFALRSFSDASLNQIIKTAKIPWGSFYQYFNDKEDIYLYVINEISKEKWDALIQSKVAGMEENFFDNLRKKIVALIELGKHNPAYGRIYMLMETDMNEFVRKQRGDSVKRWRELIEHDKRRGLIKPEVDAEVMINMIYSFVLLEYYRIGQDENQFLARLDHAIKIMQEGIMIE